MGTYHCFLLICCSIGVSGNLLDERPRILSDHGHLVFITAENRNISFLAGKSASIQINGEDLVGFTQKVRNVSQALTNLELNELPDIRRMHQTLQSTLVAPNAEIVERIEGIESGLRNVTVQVTEAIAQANITRRVRRLTTNVNILANRLQQIQQTLEANECSSNPCRNGGTCIDGFGSFQCICPVTWEGANCETDVNECANFLGTGLGCQNGATCVNLPGSYRCMCTSGWFGIHCTTQSDACSSGSGRELCGNGMCISQPGSGRGYSCICDQGWKSESNSPACTIDIDECQSAKPPCSIAPAVQCVNTPGSYMCGPCPQGYTGNGHYCIDIDECLINNGGCSQMPRVQCINTIGSRQCGPCPAGYDGDGISCRFVGACAANNGGCHPLATCIDNPAISTSYVYCQCRPGFTGSGMGPMGCMPSGGLLPSGGGSYNPGGGAVAPLDPCANNPCAATGTCIARGASFACICAPGYTGQRCDGQLNLCESNPCQNGGTCSSNGAVYRCVCPAQFTGYNCETQLESCGGLINQSEGSISYPASGAELYPHRVSCAWVIRTDPAKVLNVTFSRLNIEGSGAGQCRFDWLQIHDGETTQARNLGRFCGEMLPLGGRFLSTHNHLYLWFRSDHSTSGTGFELSWNSIDPVCGGILEEANHGAINSPGYPGQYPHLRDCYWTVSVPPGKRIQFTFATLQIEHHDNCTFDFLEIRDGSTELSPVLGRFCSAGNPPPLITTGQNALLHFHSDDADSDYGFHITYASIAAIPGCGGLLTSPEGTLSSPNHPDSYDHNLNCEWVIRAPAGERLLLSFGEMHLENSRQCRFDYIEVRDGGNSDSPSLGRYCGSNLPAAIQSSSSQLYVKFRSDYSISRGGFRARYQTICGGEFTEEAGLIKSPFYPAPYPANRDCLYVIALQPGRAVSLTFQTFDVEGSVDCLYDYIELRDGDDSNSTLIGRYCGGPDRIPPPIITTHNYLWMKFKTDGSLQNRGFYANYSSVDVTCGGILTNATGVVASPLHPSEYPHGVVCRWVIRGQPGSIVRLTFQTFSLESGSSCAHDYVEVFDNTSVSMGSGRIGRYCGQATPPVITTVANVMTIIFKADDSVAAEGFTASYSILDQTQACGGDFYTTYGVVQSPGYPGNYLPSRDCVWTVYYRYGYQIKLSVLDFEMEYHTRCDYDYLEIRNGKYASSPLIGRYCGNAIPPTIASHGNQLYVRFVSDSSRSGKGFQLTWEATATGCGGTITTPSGSISSPTYPSPPRRGVTCAWVITVSAGSRAQLAFSDLDMGTSQTGSSCMYDFVEIRDGDHSRAKLIGKYCGTTPPLTPVLATGRSLHVKYVSVGSARAGRGFMARHDTNCNIDISGLAGVIESPNFPYPYPHGKNCTWNVLAPLGNKINVTFSHFEVESSQMSDICLHDYLEIRDGVAGANQTVVGHFCGPQIPLPISSHSDRLQIQFETDTSTSGTGFRLEWEVHGCGGIFTKPFGFLQSPNYPEIYPVAVDCVWQIKAEYGSRIEFTAQDFDIEGALNCQFDFLKVHGGPDSQSLVLATLCNHQMSMPVIMTSGGSDMYVHFHSDGSVRGKGFRASYKTLPGGCGGVLTAPSGAFHSPNYPQNYDHGANCGWNITVAQNHVVELTFSDFDVEPGANCTFDYVAVHDGPTEEYPVLIHHCGNSAPNMSVIRSTSNQMFVRLVTDSTITSRGFSANFTTGCGARIVTSSEGELTSPFFPSVFGLGLDCTWIIGGAEATDRVTLTFTHLDIQTRGLIANCSDDFVQVLEGDSADSPLIGRYCLSSVPPPVVSQGNSLFVHFVAERGVGAGFRATYSVISGACGGNFTSEHGVFASPNYPDSYPPVSECVWTISASFGNRVLVSFRQLNIQESEFCNSDYVELRKNDASGPLIGHFCGSSLPSNITASNRIWIKFRSDEEGTAPGFVADYSLLHGNELYGNSGKIASPLYPLRFTKVAEYTWRIVADQGLRVVLRFEQLTVERNPINDACVSTVSVYDGFDETSPLLSSLCGRRPPREYIIGSSNVVFVKFSSVPMHEGSLFVLNWEAWPEGQVEQRLPVGRCGTDIFVTESNTTSITTPGFPIGYGHNLRCYWSITAPAHMRVELRFVTIDVESAPRCLLDRIELRTTMIAPQRICSRDQEGQVVTSASNSLRLFFYTDATVNYTGVNMTATAVCGGILTEQRGVIETPRYPENYPAGTVCEWVVRVRTGRTIQLEFDEMAISTSQDCTRDYVVIRNGESVDSPFLGSGKFCGSAIPQIHETSSNTLHVKFVSDRSSRGSKGFRLFYTEKSLACGGQLFLTNGLEEGLISSPNYPSPSSPNAECEWTVVAPPGKSIQLDFEHPFLNGTYWNCYSYGVEIRDGASTRSPLLGRYCDMKPGTVVSSSNAMYVRFYIRGLPIAAFAARLSIAKCGGTVVGSRGVISSPRFPGAYDPNSNCTWHVNGPEGHALNFYFTSIDLPAGLNCSSRDYVEIREPDVEEPVGTYCGQTVSPVQIRAGGNAATVRFVSGNRAESRTGFRLVYNASVESCGGELDSPEGIIQSPAYPNPYPNSVSCMWKITVPMGRKIKLEFEDFSLQPRMRSYCRDYVLAINGTWQTYMYSPASYCGDTVPSPILSSGNSLRFLFRSDSAVNSRGFRARYTSDDPADCGGDLSSAEGFITSPGFENGSFPRRSFCEWSYHNLDSESSTTVFNFVTEEIDNVTIGGTCGRSNNVQLMLGSGPATRDVQSFITSCYTRTEPYFVYSPYAYAKIGFSSKDTVFRGFNMTYKRNPCGGTLRDAANISSPGYPSNYPLSIDCVWLFDFTEEGGVPHVTLSDFDLGSGSDCSSTYLSIRSGASESSPEIDRYCSSNLPPLNQAIVPSSSSIWIHLHVAADVPKKGFSANVSPVNNGCGGYFHGSSGSLQSPSYPGRYPHNTECVWVVQMEPGFRLLVNFTERFDLENSTDCRNDYVEIFEGNEEEVWTSLGKFCGKHNPGFVVTNSQSAKIVFRTNENVDADGFKATWQRGCGGIYNSSSGSIMSPGYPNQYTDNLICTYVIVASPDSYVLLNFEEPFDLEASAMCRYDRVTLYQGVTDLSRPLGRYCGSQKPSGIIGSKGPMVVQFFTDSAVTGKGFMATFSVEECGGTITEPTIIKSLAHPSPYLNNLNCTWTIQAPANQVPELKFDFLEIEGHSACRYDYLAVYDTEISNSTLIGKYCGPFNVTLPRVKSVGSTMIVQLKTDHSYSQGGFSAAVLFTYGPNQGCGGRINVRAGSADLRSVDADRNGQYEPNLDCRWLLVCEPGQVLRLQFSVMDVEESVNGTCYHDYVEVRDGMGITSSLIGQYCGTTTPPALVASSNFMFVRFVTDFTTNRRGFVASATNLPPICGPSLPLIATNQTQEITSPNYPNQYGQNLRCRYVIDMPDADRTRKIDVKFLDMDIENDCSKDRLEIEDLPSGSDFENRTISDLVVYGDTAISVPVGPQQVILEREVGRTLRFCGSSIPHDVFSTGRSLSLTFITDGSGSGRGFKLQYSLATCNRTYYGPQGRIVSSSWPWSIAPNERCQMTIETEANTTISLYMTLFRLTSSRNCSEGYMNIYDGNSVQSPLLRSACGLSLPLPVFSSGNRLFIDFKNAKSPTAGYDITYTATTQGKGCGGPIFNTRGSFTSPFYPAVSNISSDCTWDISVPLGYIVKLDFTAFEIFPINDDGSCASDSIELLSFDPASGAQTSRGVYCGTQPPATYLGATNSVIVRYVASTNRTGTGWRAYFVATKLAATPTGLTKP